MVYFYTVCLFLYIQGGLQEKQDKETMKITMIKVSICFLQVIQELNALLKGASSSGLSPFVTFSDDMQNVCVVCYCRLVIASPAVTRIQVLAVIIIILIGKTSHSKLYNLLNYLSPVIGIQRQVQYVWSTELIHAAVKGL